MVPENMSSPRLTPASGRRCGLSIPAHVALGHGGMEESCVFTLTFLPFLPCSRFYHVGNLLQLVLLGWTA